MKLVSIVMPVFNAEKTIKKSIDSVLAQTANNWELIAVDDDSMDSSLRILQEYAEKDSRIKVVHQENMGPGGARNTAISKSTGDYIAFLDADDWYENNFLELVNEKIETKDCDLIFYDYFVEKSTGEVLKTGRISKFQDEPKNVLIRYQMTGKLEWGMVKVIRKQIVFENHLGFSDDRVGEEAIFSFSVLDKASTISFIDKPVYHYVFFGSGQHKKGGDDPWGMVVSKMKDHLQSSRQYELYEQTINSFALKALIISCYRLSTDGPYKAVKKKVKQKIERYNREYNFNRIDKDALDSGSRLLRLFVLNRFVLPLFVASRLRARKRRG